MVAQPVRDVPCRYVFFGENPGPQCRLPSYTHSWDLNPDSDTLLDPLVGGLGPYGLDFQGGPRILSIWFLSSCLYFDVHPRNLECPESFTSTVVVSMSRLLNVFCRAQSL